MAPSASDFTASPARARFGTFLPAVAIQRRDARALPVIPAGEPGHIGFGAELREILASIVAEYRKRARRNV
jgi:hypothetical protein